MSFYIRKQIHVLYYDYNLNIIVHSINILLTIWSWHSPCNCNPCPSQFPATATWKTNAHQKSNKTSGSGAPLHPPLHVESYPFTISQFVKSIQHTFYTHLEQSWLDHCPKSVRMGPLLTAKHNSKMNVSQGSMIPSMLLLSCFSDSLKGKKTDIIRHPSAIHQNNCIAWASKRAWMPCHGRGRETAEVSSCHSVLGHDTTFQHLPIFKHEDSYTPNMLPACAPWFWSLDTSVLLQAQPVQ